MPFHSWQQSRKYGSDCGTFRFLVLLSSNSLSLGVVHLYRADFPSADWILLSNRDNPEIIGFDVLARDMLMSSAVIAIP